MEKLMGFWCVIVGLILCCKCDNIVESLEDDGEVFIRGKQRINNVSMLRPSECGIPDAYNFTSTNALMVPLTLIHGAAAKGAVCLDGTLPGYHLSRGFGSGEKSWFVQLEGGGWCDSVQSCVKRKMTYRGSSKYFEKEAHFTGILSNKPQENPDFYNWNRVKVLYCDGASFAGDSENQGEGLQFRGQRIWQAAMEELMSQGMIADPDRALLTGCSAGGLATILHCNEFRDLFTSNTKVKCLSDAGLFMDAKDVSGVRTLRNFFNAVVTLQGVEKNLPKNCTDHLDPTSCFFPQNLIPNVKAPLFILNSAYDSWQFQQSLAPPTADPYGHWNLCRENMDQCSTSQIQFLRGFRDEMVDALKSLATSRQSGFFIKSCLFHCQSEIQSRWFAPQSPAINGKAVATSVGDWYFDRATTKAIACRFPYDKPCYKF